MTAGCFKTPTSALVFGNLQKQDGTQFNIVSASLCSLSSQLRGPVAPYTPVFLDGWKPEASRADGQVWEDPVESQHKHEDLRLKQQVWNNPRVIWVTHSIVSEERKAQSMCVKVQHRG